MYGFRHKRIDYNKRFLNGKIYINGIEGFWSYAKRELLKFYGLLSDNFLCYLKELEFRYNNRKENLFDKMLETIKCGIN
jgi:transposase